MPIYNEEEGVRGLHEAIVAAMDRLELPWDVLYVNDGSTDRSLELLLEVQAADGRITIIELSRNWGHQPALTAGLTHATGDAVVLMDGDMQDPPSAILEMVKEWQAGAKVVITERRGRRESLVRKVLFATFYKLLGFVSDYPIPLNAGIFGLLDRQIVNEINRLSETNRYFPGLRAWVGYRTSIVSYERAARAAGEPKQGFWRLLRYALNAIFSFSYKPLQISLVLGIVTAMFAVCFGILLIVCRIKGIGLFGLPVVTGYTSTIVSILFLGGVQLISAGILGEYIGRIYDEVKRRPLYLVHTVHEGKAQKRESARVHKASAS